MKKVLLFASMAALALSGCKKDDNATRLFKGKPVAFQKGTAFMWYEVDKTNKPLRVATAIDDAAMASLDRGDGQDGHTHNNSVSLPMPKQANSSIFTHGLLNWNPVGHPLQGIYDLPHFDFHFFTISETDRLAIPPYNQAPDKWNNYPPADYMPLNYVPVTPGVPHMNGHWVDKTSPEFNGQKFTQSYIYGSYDGKLTYQEPMVLESFLTANAGFTRSIPQAAKVEKPGWYPTKMRIEKADGTTSVILEEFIRRQPN
jgi:hypothetical protein